MDKEEAKDGIETLVLLSFALISLIIGVAYAWHQELERWAGDYVIVYYAAIMSLVFVILCWNFLVLRAVLRVESRTVIRRPGKKRADRPIKVEKGAGGKL